MKLTGKRNSALKTIMECILCLHVQELKSEQIDDIEYSVQECLNICKKYLTVELTDLEEEKFNDSSTLCCTCFPSVTKLVNLHNNLMTYSQIFSERLLNIRRRRDVTFGNEINYSTDNYYSSAEDSCSVIEEIKSEIEDDDLETVDKDSILHSQTFDTHVHIDNENDLQNYKKNSQFFKKRISNNKAISNTTDTFKPKKLKNEIKRLKPSTDVAQNNLHSKSTNYKNKCSARKQHKVNRKTCGGDSENESTKKGTRAIRKISKKVIESKIRKTSVHVKYNIFKKRNNITKNSKKTNEANNSAKAVQKSDSVEEKVFSCDVCGKVIISGKASFDDHRRLHTGEKPFKCDEGDCQMTFRTLLNLSVHKAYNHTAEYPHACKFVNCEKKFKLKSQLWSHRETYHKDTDKLHICEHCGQSFKFKGRLGIHLRKHNAEDRFYCSQCSRSFTTKSQLNVHVQLVHTKEISYVCEVCGKSLTSKLRLQDHSRTHSGEKYNCDQCGKLYASRTSLNLHRRNAKH